MSLYSSFLAKNMVQWAVAVTQFGEWSLPTADVRGSNPVIDKILCTTRVYLLTKNKEKGPGMAHFKNRVRNS